jgi:hypothetical protein
MRQQKTDLELRVEEFNRAAHVRFEAATKRCPRCDSPAPHLHPAVQHEGEVQPCSDAFHLQPTPENIGHPPAPPRTP